MIDGYLTLAFLLIALGVILLAAEFFLYMPTGGVLVVVGLGLIVTAIGVILRYGSTTEAVAAVIAVCVGVPVGGSVLTYAWRRLTKQVSLDSETVSATATSTPEVAELDRLKGRYGRTVSPMRPSGTVEIDGRRIDAMTEGRMLDANVWVKCVEVRAGRVIVRQVDTPDELTNIELDDLK